MDVALKDKIVPILYIGEVRRLSDDCRWDATGEGKNRAEGVFEAGRAVCAEAVRGLNMELKRTAILTILLAYR